MWAKAHPDTDPVGSMRFLNSVIQMMLCYSGRSESIAIPYRNPITGKSSQYIPDILMTYRTRGNQVRAELIEIKPRKQSVIEEKMSV
jgi:hypothetical protein